MRRICKQCGKEFEITGSEIQFYRKKNLSLPKRCKECRQKNKTGNAQGSSVYEPGRGIGPAGSEAEHSGINKNQNLPGGKQNRVRGGLAVIVLLILLAAAGNGIFGWLPAGSGSSDASGRTGQEAVTQLTFRSEKLREEHYEKHGISMGFDSPEEYEAAAAAVVSDSSVLHKTEKEDGDDVYYLEATNEFVIVSTDGYIRTYFEPEDGIDYYKRQ